MGVRHETLRRALPALCALLPMALGCGPALAGNMVATSPWTVHTQTGPDGKSACAADATYVSFPVEVVEESTTLSLRADGTAALRFATVVQSLEPSWLRGKTYAEHPATETKRAWFDHGAAFPVKVINNGLAYLEIDFPNTRGLLDGMAVSRTLTLEMDPAGSGVGSFGERVSVPSTLYTYQLDDMAQLIGDLRRCQQALLAHLSYETQPGPAAANDVSSPTSYVPLIEALRGEASVAERAGPDSVALINALLRLGDAEADAFQFGDARDSYSKGLSLADRLGESGPKEAAARARLIAVDIGLERVDEAESLARTTPDPQPWLAAVAVMRGDDQDGREQFLKLLGDRAGHAFSSLQEFKNWTGERNLLTPDPRLPSIRELLLLWASAALGQEDWVSHDAFHYFYGESNGASGAPLVPAALVAESLFGCLDPEMIRDDAQSSRDTRLMLGQAALIRGESLRQAGDLGTVASDLAYAGSEFAGIQQGLAWTGWTRAARLSLKADLGLDDEATTDDARQTLQAAEEELGRRSWVWMKTALLVAELELRQGDAAAAEQTAVRAADVAAAALSPEHSLTRKLRLEAARARLSRQDLPGAARLAAQTLGFAKLPAVASDQLESATRDLDDPHRLLQALAKLLGASAPDRTDGPAAQRIQARRAEQLIMEALRRRPSSNDSAALQAILDFASASDSALRNEDERASGSGRHLNEPPDTLAGLLQKLEFWHPSFSMQEVMTTIRPDAADFMRPDLVVPADYRPNVRYGAETEALEALLRDMHQLFDSPKTRAEDRAIVYDAALQLAAAASRGDASATISAEFYANGSGLGDAQLARRAVSTALFSRRLRSALWQETDVPAAVGTRRRLYVRSLEYATLAAARITKAYAGNALFSYIEATQWGSADVSAPAYARNLGPHQAVVVWLPLETTTQMFVIGPQGPVWRELPEGRRSLVRRVEAIRRSIELAASQIRSGGRPTLADFPVEDARALYRALFSPLEADLREVTDIFCAQLGALGGLPLQLLRTDAADAGSAAWLGDRFALTRMPGLLNPFVLYGNQRRGDGPASRLLAVGAPAMSLPSSAASTGRVTEAIAELPPLPNAAGEMLRAAKALGVELNKSNALQNGDATKEAVLQRLGASAHDLILFATHGLVGGEAASVGEPALVLASPVRSAWFDNGLLYASDVAALHASADLVILSACSTASLGQDGGEPLAGLASAFMTAGSRYVVASYWTLADETAGELTSMLVRGRFAEHLDVAGALQRAVAALRTSGGADRRYDHPVYWAPFVVVGLPWIEPPHGHSDFAPARFTPAIPAAPSPSAIPPRAVVPLDVEASRLVTAAAEAQERGDCELGMAKICALGELLHDPHRSTEERKRIAHATMGLILEDQRCEINRNLQHSQ